MKIKNLLFVLFITLSSASMVAQTGNESTKAYKIQEVLDMDSAAVSELVKRAINFVKAETKEYKKSSGVTTGSKVECNCEFQIKPKELNPKPDWTGKVVMKVKIECKPNKVRYTVFDVKHISQNGRVNGGDLNNIVPECGSWTMPDRIWKKVKSKAVKCAEKVVEDLKVYVYAESSLYAKQAEDEW